MEASRQSKCKEDKSMLRKVKTERGWVKVLHSADSRITSYQDLKKVSE